MRDACRTQSRGLAGRGLGAFLATLCALVSVASAQPLAGTRPLTIEGDLSAQMVDGIGTWLDRETQRAAGERGAQWARAGVDQKRARLREILGMSDARVRGRFDVAAGPRDWLRSRERTPGLALPVGAAMPVQWSVFDDLRWEGLLLHPPRYPRAIVVVIPDADQTSEMLAGLQPGLDESMQVARILAGRECLVVVPALIDRRSDWSGSERLQRFTNQPHREWIYRQTFGLGRTLGGYEVQMVQSAIDAALDIAPELPVGIFGYGEGGITALHCAALDPRVAATVVSGSFGPREGLWSEPIDRNRFGLLREFGDAEIAALAAPHPLFVEYGAAPSFDGPPAPSPGRAGAAPGRIQTPALPDVEAEIRRANARAGAPTVTLLRGPAHARFGRPESLAALLAALGRKDATVSEAPLVPAGDVGVEGSDRRQQRLVRGCEEHTQQLLRLSESARAPKLWSNLKNADLFAEAQRDLRHTLAEQVIGRIPPQDLPPAPRTRALPPHPKWSGYEVVLDVLPDVFAWGWLLVPKDLQPGERRPVVVCQHGLEGLPEDVVNEDPKARAFAPYKGFAAELAARGFIVYAPHNPYRGKDAFRLLQRKANPLGLSLFSFIVAQHDVTTRWLATLPFVDPARIAFYGLSYGGKTAMRVPALLDRYCLSICSGDFNEWIGKTVGTHWTGCYPFTPEWEMPEWNLGHVAGYAEMAMLIAPRPFMVERGHDDGVALDQWVGYEWAKVQRGYDKRGLGDRAEIEWFEGPHTIHGAGTFRFLEEQLRWPASQP